MDLLVNRISCVSNFEEKELVDVVSRIKLGFRIEVKTWSGFVNNLSLDKWYILIYALGLTSCGPKPLVVIWN